MMAERCHLRGMLQRDDRAPIWDDSKPQAQRVVRCLWSCACQWCDVLTECSRFWPGNGLEGKKHWSQCSMFQCWWTSRSSVFGCSERVMCSPKPGFDQHDGLPDRHENCLCGRLSVSQFVCQSVGGVAWHGMNGWRVVPGLC